MKKKVIKKDIKAVVLLVILSIITVLVLSIGIYRDKKLGSEHQKFAEEYNKKMQEERLAKEENDRRIKESLPVVSCWGDSLTAGVGGEGVTYPKVLSQLSKLAVYNYGVGGESSKSIAIRQGAIAVYTKELIIPKDIKDVEISLYDEQGDNIKLGVQGDSGLNPCEINSVIGKIIYNNEDGKMYFRREQSGEEVHVESGTKLITSGSKDKDSSDILVIFSGSNDGIKISNIEYTIEIQKKMINYSGIEKYIVIGLTSKNAINDVEQVNEVLKQEYGDKFIDVRKYILENGLAEVGIETTEQDKIDIKNGEIPSSLRIDSIHGNSNFYKLIGNKVYEKIIELGYINDEQKEYLGIN